ARTPVGAGGIVRVQARRATRGRPGVRRARLAQPLLACAPAPVHRPRCPGAGIPVPAGGEPCTARRSLWLPDALAAALRTERSPVLDRRHRLHRRPASLRLRHRTAGCTPSQSRCRCAEASPGKRLMLETELEVSNVLGLHARAAAKVVSVASRYKSRIQIVKAGRPVDAKSIMALLM